MPRDVDAAREPDALMPGGVVDKAFERGGAARPPGEATMQPDRHHARPRLALAIENVEAVLQIGEELITRVEALRRREAHVVRVEGIGDDQLRLAAGAVP